MASPPHGFGAGIVAFVFDQSLQRLSRSRLERSKTRHRLAALRDDHFAPRARDLIEKARSQRTHAKHAVS
jgi:hypothetical protein